MGVLQWLRSNAQQPLIAPVPDREALCPNHTVAISLLGHSGDWARAACLGAYIGL